MTKLEEGQSAYQQRHNPQGAKKAAADATKVRDTDDGPVSTTKNALQRGRDNYAAKKTKVRRNDFNF